MDGQQTSHIAIVCLLTRSFSCNKDFEMKVLLSEFVKKAFFKRQTKKNKRPFSHGKYLIIAN